MEYEICAEWETRPDIALPPEDIRAVRSVRPRANRDESWARHSRQQGLLIPEEEG